MAAFSPPNPWGGYGAPKRPSWPPMLDPKFGMPAAPPAGPPLPPFGTPQPGDPMQLASTQRNGPGTFGAPPPPGPFGVQPGGTAVAPDAPPLGVDAMLGQAPKMPGFGAAPQMPGLGRDQMPQRPGFGAAPVGGGLGASDRNQQAQSTGTGTGGGGSTGVEPTDPLSDPTTAVTRALMALGHDPGRDYTPYVQGILRRARELVHNALGRMVQQGQWGALGTDQGLQGAIQDLVQQALTGGRVFGTAGSDQGMGTLLGQINQLASPDYAGGGAGGLRLAKYLSDTGNAANLTRDLMYGGLSRPLSDVYGRALSTPLARYEQGLEDGTAGGYGNLLAYLLGPGASSLYF